MNKKGCGCLLLMAAIFGLIKSQEFIPGLWLDYAPLPAFRRQLLLAKEFERIPATDCAGFLRFLEKRCLASDQGHAFYAKRAIHTCLISYSSSDAARQFITHSSLPDNEKYSMMQAVTKAFDEKDLADAVRSCVTVTSGITVPNVKERIPDERESRARSAIVDAIRQTDIRPHIKRTGQCSFQLDVDYKIMPLCDEYHSAISFGHVQTICTGYKVNGQVILKTSSSLDRQIIQVINERREPTPTTTLRHGQLGNDNVASVDSSFDSVFFRATETVLRRSWAIVQKAPDVK